jgi:hypothetical protein
MSLPPIDHPPGHEIERLNQEIDEQYEDVEPTAASTIATVIVVLIVLFVMACWTLG